jgi:hypothetical protein
MSTQPLKNDRRDHDVAEDGDVTASKVPAWTLWLAVAWLLAFFKFFFSIDLPNSVPMTNRADLWLDLPDLLISCVVQDDDASPARWSFFFEQRLGIVLLAGAILVAGVAVGRLVLRALGLTGCSGDGRAIERNTLAAGAGSDRAGGDVARCARDGAGRVCRD